MTNKHEGEPVAVDVAGLRALLERATPSLAEGNVSASQLASLLRRAVGGSPALRRFTNSTDFDADGSLLAGAVAALPALLATAERLAVVEEALERIRDARLGEYGVTDADHRWGFYAIQAFAHAALNSEHPNHG